MTGGVFPPLRHRAVVPAVVDVVVGGLLVLGALVASPLLRRTGNR